MATCISEDLGLWALGAAAALETNPAPIPCHGGAPGATINQNNKVNKVEFILSPAAQPLSSAFRKPSFVSPTTPQPSVAFCHLGNTLSYFRHPRLLCSCSVSEIQVASGGTLSGACEKQGACCGYRRDTWPHFSELGPSARMAFLFNRARNRTNAADLPKVACELLGKLDGPSGAAKVRELQALIWNISLSHILANPTDGDK